MPEHHNLLNEFPEYKERIHELKLTDRHFSNLFDEYHMLDREILRIELGIETPSDQYTEDLKKKRVHLKDELYRLLQAAG
jgi:uncharacterized protein